MIGRRLGIYIYIYIYMQIHVTKYNSPCKFQLWVNPAWRFTFLLEIRVSEKNHVYKMGVETIMRKTVVYIYIYIVSQITFIIQFPNMKRDNISVFASLLYNTCFREQSCLQNMCDTHLGKELQIHIIYNHINCALFLILQITAMSKTHTFRRICDL